MTADKGTTDYQGCICGREIIRPWINGVQQPWCHWVEPMDHEATPADKGATNHVHEWTDAPEDEELWYCPGCGRIETQKGEFVRRALAAKKDGGT